MEFSVEETAILLVELPSVNEIGQSCFCSCLLLYFECAEAVIEEMV